MNRHYEKPDKKMKRENKPSNQIKQQKRILSH
jgi:hypothetical protein